MTQLVLSLFPGIGLLDMAFEEEGFCVVRGPDLLWGGDIRRFHPPAGHFDGVIGGPPCQAFSSLRHLVTARYGPEKVKPNMIPEFERCVREARPLWFLMENVPEAPAPLTALPIRQVTVTDVAVGGITSRVRRFTYGGIGCGKFYVDEMALHCAEPEPAVCGTAGGREATPPLREKLRGQGLPEDFFEGMPFTLEGKRVMIGNGVPLPMGRAVAKAVKRALGITEGR